MTIPSEIRNQVYKRDGWKCRACKSREQLHPHHLIFKSHGGPDETWNLVTLCSSCHSKVHDTVGSEKLVVLAKSGNPDDQADANVGLKFKKIKRDPVLGAESRADDNPSKPLEAKAKLTTEDRTGTANIPTGATPEGDVDTENLTPNTAFRVEALARYSKTYTGYVDLGNYRKPDLAKKRLAEITAEGYQNGRIKRIELD